LRLIGSCWRLMSGVVGLRSCRFSQAYWAKWKMHGRIRIWIWILMDEPGVWVITWYLRKPGDANTKQVSRYIINFSNYDLTFTIPIRLLDTTQTLIIPWIGFINSHLR
jgi:hypothetical protein